MVFKVYEMYVLILIFLFCLVSISSLDVSWIPTDPDGPLPLSSNYRAALAKLCTMIGSGQTLPNEIKTKLPVLKKMCIKLNEASSYSSLSSWIPWEKFQSFSKHLISSSSINNIILTLAIAGGGSYVWYNRKPMYRYLQSKYRIIQQQSRSNKNGSNSNSDSSTRKRSNSHSSGSSSSSNVSSSKIDMAAIREARIKQYANFNSQHVNKVEVDSNNTSTISTTTNNNDNNNSNNDNIDDDDDDDASR